MQDLSEFDVRSYSQKGMMYLAQFYRSAKKGGKEGMKYVKDGKDCWKPLSDFIMTYGSDTALMMSNRPEEKRRKRKKDNDDDDDEKNNVKDMERTKKRIKPNEQNGRVEINLEDEEEKEEEGGEKDKDDDDDERRSDPDYEESEKEEEGTSDSHPMEKRKSRGRGRRNQREKESGTGKRRSYEDEPLEDSSRLDKERMSSEGTPYLCSFFRRIDRDTIAYRKGNRIEFMSNERMKETFGARIVDQFLESDPITDPKERRPLPAIVIPSDLCRCVPPVEAIVRRCMQGKNSGRLYMCCHRYGKNDKGCGYFRWIKS